MTDKYDEAIEYLATHPGEIRAAWREASTEEGEQEHPAHCLFQGATKNGHIDLDAGCGCLTQIRCGFLKAETPELTEAIKSDMRIPASVLSVKVNHLPIFAEWQRRIDKELNRS